VNAKTILIVLLLMATALTALTVSPVARGATLINSQLVEETGPTSALGGGDHVFVRFGTDAAFGVVYGTTANPNSIYIVAIKARYLGVAQVVDQAGASVASNRPIKIYTLYALKLDSLIEFRDGNGNSVADYARVYNSMTGGFTDYFNRLGDTLYKKVDLKTNWTRSPIVEANGTTYRNWMFNLTAQNQPYSAVANYTGSVAGVLPLVRFTFHLNASLKQVDNVTVPQWSVTVGANSAVTNWSRMADLTVSGKVVHYDLKWDQDVEGWTYAAGNTAGVRRRILLEFGAVVGNLIPAPIVDAWFVPQAPRNSTAPPGRVPRTTRPAPTRLCSGYRPRTSTSQGTGRGLPASCGRVTASWTAWCSPCTAKSSPVSGLGRSESRATRSSGSSSSRASVSGAGLRSCMTRPSARTSRPTCSCPAGRRRSLASLGLRSRRSRSSR